MTFEEWTGGASDQEVREMIAQVRKSFWKWLLISLIPVVGQFTIGCAVFCYNNLSFLKSRGRSMGNNLVRLVMMLWGFLILPIIVVQACAKIESLGNKVLGW